VIKADKVDIDTTVTAYVENQIESYDTNILSKTYVAQVEGKGLSTEDYTKAKKDMDSMIGSAVKAQKTLEKVNAKFSSNDIQGYNK
jgi:hypothetical protein